ncbi:MAG: HypC/HybG/HupF family hydrogenase formation chaperone [Proteobacteria bacterium]|nr:HypC/HybG/HupF family hydrogenase formation chaperone [Desulfobulbaceae bacterium]MBU4152534.1 HypC/HybG/HupF family hydrogenase formation chaperone [Pseudomonadota bacterium]
MCLAIPGKLIAKYENTGLKMGQVDYDGTISNVCLEYVPEIEIGQYTVVHAGFALSVLDEEEARKTLELWQELLEKADQMRNNEQALIRSDDDPLS